MAATDKVKSVFVCQACGHTHQKWLGCCSGCGDWNTLEEQVLGSAKTAGYAGERVLTDPVALTSVDCVAYPRTKTGSSEFDRALGGGLVMGSVVLLGGDPGVGKSTLLLQVMHQLSEDNAVLYVTGEESLAQVALRAKRLGLHQEGMVAWSETDITSIIAKLSKIKPKVVVIDSIQTLSSSELSATPGSVTQVKACTHALVTYAKQHQTTILLVGHVTKEGHLAGPRVLEHMVDTVLSFSGEGQERIRLLRATKNRFGPVNELGVFAMVEGGIKDVHNPSALFLSRPIDAVPGSGVMVMWEGTRPLLIEVQALLDECIAQPRRLALGVDPQRLNMLLAILHRHGGISTHGHDVFLNVVGGLKVQETAADLAILATLVSSLKNQPLPADLALFGEIGLGGEIRPVPHGQDRIQAAIKQGYRTLVVPKANQLKSKAEKEFKVIGVTTVSDALEVIFS